MCSFAWLERYVGFGTNDLDVRAGQTQQGCCQYILEEVGAGMTFFPTVLAPGQNRS